MTFLLTGRSFFLSLSCVLIEDLYFLSQHFKDKENNSNLERGVDVLRDLLVKPFVYRLFVVPFSKPEKIEKLILVTLQSASALIITFTGFPFSHV